MVDESKQLQGNKDGDKHQTQELTNTSGELSTIGTNTSTGSFCTTTTTTEIINTKSTINTGSARSSQGRSNQPQYSQADLNRIVLEYLNKRISQN